VPRGRMAAVTWRLEVLLVFAPTKVPNRGVSVWTVQVQAHGVDLDEYDRFRQWVEERFTVVSPLEWISEDHDVCPDCRCGEQAPTLLFSVRVHGGTKVEARRWLESLSPVVTS
jgi:hypothetical protein